MMRSVFSRPPTTRCSIPLYAGCFSKCPPNKRRVPIFSDSRRRTSSLREIFADFSTVSAKPNQEGFDPAVDCGQNLQAATISPNRNDTGCRPSIANALFSAITILVADDVVFAKVGSKLDFYEHELTARACWRRVVHPVFCADRNKNVRTRTHRDHLIV